MALTMSPGHLEPVSPWSFSTAFSATAANGAVAAVQNLIMSVEASSPIPSPNISKSYEERKKKWELSSGQSTESEGPVIVINETAASSGSEGESFDASSNDDIVCQRFRMISLSECDSVQSSGTDFTSEGGESEIERRPWTPASTAVLTKFLEDALSDEGLSQDLFLLKHVRRHRHGFISLKLLAGYKQAKKLNCDWHALSLAARQSTLIEVNADGRKIRRKKPLPEELLHVPPSRVVAAVDIPENLMSMESLASTFAKFGNLASLHLMRHKPGGGVAEELQSLVARVPEVSHTHCALLQFETVWGVARALKEFSNPRTSLHVLHTYRRPSLSSVLRRNSMTPTNSHYHNVNPRHIVSAKMKENLESDWRKRITNGYRKDSTGSEAEDSDFKRGMGQFDSRKPRGSLPSLTPLKNFSPQPPSLPNSPKVNRRHSGTTGVIRIPKGPDGTKGFRNSVN